MAEIWDLYTIQRCPLGTTAVRGQALPEGAYHIVVTVWVVCPGRGVLLTLRHPEKPVYPNTWENTGGSVLAGETSLSGACRELFEETGITAKEEELQFLQTHVAGSALMDTYLLCRDVDTASLTMQRGETVAVQIASFARLRQMAANGALAAPIAQQFYKLENVLERATGTP
ncbi:NUDIX domain-containing protein [Ruminococcaceae bacterium OttesenSCG-928-N02]|nr:NUDIX domain-containing protein [Ruminococcaceae bacterium OttesenSCG-928-N02]